MSVPQVSLGRQGLKVSAQGLGCMTMTAFYGNFDRKASEETSLQTIAAALEQGVNFLDTAWIYQSLGADGNENTTNEELIGKAIAKHGRDKFVIATKTGIHFTADGMRMWAAEDKIREQLAQSLARLGTDYIDLYYCHRMPMDVSVEDMMMTMKKLVDEGKIRYVGLSECTPEELRRAHTIHPVSAIQMEWSLQSRDIEEYVVPVARELGVGIVAYSPLGRGFLSQTFNSREDLSPNDWRLKGCPKFSEENFQKNLAGRQHFLDMATAKGVSPAQLALAWVHAQGVDVVPIPGTKSPARAVENAGAVALAQQLDAVDVAALSKDIPPFVGERYEGNFGTFNSRMNL